jgi:hypothetical protein
MMMYSFKFIILINFLVLASCSTSKVKSDNSNILDHNKKQVLDNSNYSELQFVLANYDRLILEISRGKGQKLERYSEILGITKNDRDLFYNEIKINSDFLSRQEFPYTLYKEIRNTLSKNKEFSHLTITL